MKVRISFPVFLGLVILLIGGLFVLKKGGSPSTSPNSNQTVSDAQVPTSAPTSRDTRQLKVSGRLVDGVREVKVVAKQWEFSPNPIVVKKGEKVRLRIKSVDVTHGFALPDFGINEVLNPGQEITIEFKADKQGTFEFFCSVQCGEGHAGMRERLVVR